MRSFNLSLISTYRQEMMGISAIAILLCHAPGNHVLMPTILSRILVRGGWGVDIFLLLSGVGMYYSLNKLSSLNKTLVLKWYKVRYTRILIPYLCIIVPTYILQYLFCGGNITDYILNISTYNFWLKHEGVWFVAMLIPLYFITPFIFKIFNISNNVYIRTLTFIFLSIISVSLSTLNVDGCNLTLINIIHNVQFVLARVPAFLFGMYLGVYVQQAKEIDIQTTSTISLVTLFASYIIKHFIPSATISCFLVIPIIFILVFTIDRIKSSSISKCLRGIGKVSLESYLFNVTLPPLLLNNSFKSIIYGNSILAYGNILPYLILILVGVVLSFAVNRLSSKIISHL